MRPRPSTATTRMAAMAFAIVLLSASSGRDDLAAQQPTSPTVPTSPTAPIVVPYGDRAFTWLNPSVPNSSEIAVLRGDPAKGPSTMMMKMRKVAGRMHVHTADYELVVIEGIMKHWRALRPDPGREALEALAVEGYRSGVLTHYQASQLLHMSRLEFDAFLKARQIDDHAYDVEDLEQDLATLEQLEAAGRMPRS